MKVLKVSSIAKYGLLLMIGVLFEFTTYSQMRVVLNDDVFINIEGNAFFVVQNGNSNAISTIGTGGNILSENENDVVRWRIGTGIGNYNIPWTSPNNIKIPLVFDISIAGSDDGWVDFSTWQSLNWNNNNYKPSDVTTMGAVNGSANNSDHVIDRFWVNNAESYSFKPEGEFEFGYDDLERIPAGNSIGAGMLAAQVFDNQNGEWMVPVLGSDNYPTFNVSAVPVSNSNFFRSWTLVDLAVPLAVDFGGFEVECMNRPQFILNWNTLSELNASHFMLEVSTDGLVFDEVDQVNASGTTTSVTEYSLLVDAQNTDKIQYYRLSQFDLNGMSNVLAVFTNECVQFGEILVYPNPSEGNIFLSFNDRLDKDIEIQLLTLDGKLIKEQLLLKGDFIYEIEKGNVLNGTYLLSFEVNGKTRSLRVVFI